MMWSRLSTGQAQRRFEELVGAAAYTPSDLLPEYQRLRAQLLQSIEPFGAQEKQGPGAYDVQVGLVLYGVLQAAGFELRNASDDAVWRYLSLNVFPDLVAARWPTLPEIRFWRSRSRIWLRVVWWLTHLAWQGSEAKTRSVLSNVTADTIVQLIERPGRAGFRVDVARELFRVRSTRSSSEAEFRAVMKLNTARVLVVEPALSAKGVAGYAEELFVMVSRPGTDSMTRERL